MEIRTAEFRERAVEEMANARGKMFLELMPAVFATLRRQGLSSFADPQLAQEASAAIRADAVARLPELLTEFEEQATRHGTKVLWARNAREANKIIVDLAKERGVSYVTKGKSMVSEELGLNDRLIAEGIDAFETDLGEFIAQQLHRPPFHIVGPAINVPPEEISDLFEKMDIIDEPTADPVELGHAARIYLRDKFHHLEMGITGVNMAVAETGTIINVENEGNIRMCKSSPRTLVSVMSLEKVVPTMNDALHLVRMLCRNCTGQQMSAYVSMDSGPRREGEIDGPEEQFIVIVDNGRTDIYADPKMRDALQCIRCGTCLNICPIYKQVGGYPYGWAYSGPMGQVLNPMLLGQKDTQDLYRACTLCGACHEVCPAGVNHPAHFLAYRANDAENNGNFNSVPRPLAEKAVMAVMRFGMEHGWAWRLGSRLIRPIFNNGAEGGYLRSLPGPVQGWFQSRDLPELNNETFHERWKNRLNDERSAS